FKLTQRGMFTAHARKLARTMVNSGCSREKVGPLLQRIGDVFGMKVNRSMSRRTVSRSMLEGGVASDMQIVFESTQNKGITISADSTSNRGVNFEANHVAHRVPDYESGSLTVDLTSLPKVRLTGVYSTVDHTSERSVSDFVILSEDRIDTFNRSPLAQRLKQKVTIAQMLRSIMGMNGDH
ncbi:hypothetical protein B0H15DRAFT_765510, partial [Mycena belliarum]